MEVNKNPIITDDLKAKLAKAQRILERSKSQQQVENQELKQIVNNIFSDISDGTDQD